MMIDVIKQVVSNYLNYANLSDVVFGKVVNTNPMTVRLENSTNLEIADPFLVVTDRFKTQPLAVSDRVVLIKASGGQRFVILDKL